MRKIIKFEGLSNSLTSTGAVKNYFIHYNTDKIIKCTDTMADYIREAELKTGELLLLWFKNKDMLGLQVRPKI